MSLDDMKVALKFNLQLLLKYMKIFKTYGVYEFGI